MANYMEIAFGPFGRRTSFRVFFSLNINYRKLPMN